MCLLRVCSAVRTRAGRQITVRFKGHSRPNCHCQLVRELARMAKLILLPFEIEPAIVQGSKGPFLFHHQIGPIPPCDAA